MEHIDNKHTRHKKEIGMSDNLLGNIPDQAKNAFDSMNKINQVIVANLQKVAEFQMNAVKSYAELTMNQVKTISDVRDVDSLKALGTGQAAFVNDLTQKIMDDFKALNGIGVEFKDEVEKVINEAKDGATESAEK
ncbi:MAG: phasin family protein [Gammaproteobacteria bacterium]|nr:MAG: phasin family protein [Pseudomonadota bacterium]PIE38013.1 MAG: phasin family protein [Gammaproteobacteria bacterium]